MTRTRERLLASGRKLLNPAPEGANIQAEIAGHSVAWDALLRDELDRLNLELTGIGFALCQRVTS